MSTEQSSAAFRFSPRDVLAAVPAVSALAVAALYAVGVLLSVTQLQGGDVPVLDALPLIPLQDHLTKGLGVVFTSPVLFALALVEFLLILLAYATVRSSKHRLEAADASLAALVALTDSLTSLREVGTVINSEAEALREEFHATQAEFAADDSERAEESSEQLAAALRALERSREHQRRAEVNKQRADDLMDRVQSWVATSKALGEQVDPHVRQADRDAAAAERATRFLHVPRGSAVWVGRISGAALIVAAAFAPPVPAAGSVAFGVFFVFGGVRLFFEQPLAYLAASALGIALPLVVEAYVHPAPLARATITTETAVVRGSLITSSGDRYVLTARPDAFISIPVARVRSAAVVRPRLSRPKSVRQLLFD